MDISSYYITELKFSLEYTKIYKIYKTRLMYLYILIPINICTCLRYLYKSIHIINKQYDVMYNRFIEKKHKIKTDWYIFKMLPFYTAILRGNFE